jgi:hypothetical protein
VASSRPYAAARSAFRDNVAAWDVVDEVKWSGFL